MFKSRKVNIATACLFAVLGIGLFYTPVIQKRFFEDGSGKLSEAFQGDYAGAGRFEAWPLIWEEARTRPLIGHGVGSAYDFVPEVWEDTNHCHNDYLRLFFETGVIGLAFFVFAAIYQLVVLHRLIGSTRGAVRSAYVAVWLAFWAMLVSSATDNTILYNIYFTDSLFAILGAAYGVTAAVNAGASPSVEPTRSTLTTMRYSPATR
jgi:O-antigen ligase